MLRQRIALDERYTLRVVNLSDSRNCCYRLIQRWYTPKLYLVPPISCCVVYLEISQRNISACVSWESNKLVPVSYDVSLSTVGVCTCTWYKYMYHYRAVLYIVSFYQVFRCPHIYVRSSLFRCPRNLERCVRHVDCATRAASLCTVHS